MTKSRILDIMALVASLALFAASARAEVGMYMATYKGSSGAPVTTGDPMADGEIVAAGAVVASSATTSIGGNTTVAYKGYMYLDAGVTYNFVKNFDDGGYIAITGPDDVTSVIINSSAWNATVVNSYTPAISGWHIIDLRVSQGGGGQGPVSSPFNDLLKAGLAWNAGGPSTCTTSNYDQWRRFLNGDAEEPFLYTAIPDAGIYALGTDNVTSSGFTANFRLVGTGEATVCLDVSEDSSFATNVATLTSYGAIAEGAGSLAATGLAPQTAYFWRARAVGDDVFVSETSSAKTIGAPVLGAVSAAPAGGDSVTISARLVSAAMDDTIETTLTLHYGDSEADLANSAQMGSATGPATFTVTLEGLGYGATYYYAVAASAPYGARTLSSSSATNLFATLCNGDMYVVKGNAGTPPYATPETAAPDIKTALDIATDGATIHVGDGMYPVKAPMTVSVAVSIIGNDIDPGRVTVSNTQGVAWDHQNSRVFHVDNAGAVLSGMTIAGGQNYGYGGNVLVTSNGGMITNCIVAKGYVRDNGQAAAIYTANGVVTHCRFIDNYSSAGSANWSGNRCGVALFEGSTRVENCLFERTRQSAQCHMVGVKDSAVMRNCDIVNSALTSTNAANGGSYPLYVGSSSVTVANVVIAGVTNSLGEVLGPKGSTNVIANCATDCGYALPASCVAITTAAFRDYANGDYEPASDSPLIDGGVNYSPMAMCDLTGKRKRLIGSRVDIGCYEANAVGTIVLIK